jgi:hypothetical protein
MNFLQSAVVFRARQERFLVVWPEDPMTENPAEVSSDYREVPRPVGDPRSSMLREGIPAEQRSDD